MKDGSPDPSRFSLQLPKRIEPLKKLRVLCDKVSF